MDAFSAIKKESDQEGESDAAGENQQSNVRAVEADNLLDMSQTIQQILANSVSTGTAGLLSPSQFLQASASAAISLPWLLPHYQQMLILQQRQQQFLLPNSGEVEDGQLVVVPQTEEVQDGHQDASAVTDSNPLISALLQRQVIAQLQQQQQQNLVSGGREVGTLVNLLGMQVAQADDNARNQLAIKQQAPSATEPNPQRPKPPKKPLTPYMLFSKEHWHHVKAANSHLSTVTEIGAIIGGMWRELDAEHKLKYNERFTKDKIRYDEEIRAYLQNNNLSPSDLIRTRLNRKRPLSHHQQTQQLSSSAASIPTSSASLHGGVTSKPSSPTLPAIQPGTQQPIELQQQLNVATGLVGTWSNQSIQQILASMGFAHQAIYSQGDGNAINALQDAAEPPLQAQEAWKGEGNEASPEENETDQSMPPSSSNNQTSGAEAKVWTWHHHHHHQPDDDSLESNLPMALTKTSDRVDSSHPNNLPPLTGDHHEIVRNLDDEPKSSAEKMLSMEKMIRERDDEILKLRRKLNKADQEIEQLKRSQPIQSSVTSSHPPDHPVSSSSRSNDADDSHSQNAETAIQSLQS